MAAPERFAEMSDFSLAPRAPSIHGTKRQFAIGLQLVRFWGEADINWQRENAASVANDPSRHFSPTFCRVAQHQPAIR